MGSFAEMVKWAYLIKNSNVLLLFSINKISIGHNLIFTLIFFNKNSTLIIGALWRGGLAKCATVGPSWGLITNLRGNTIKVEATLAVSSDDDVNQNRATESPSSQHFLSVDNATFNHCRFSHNFERFNEPKLYNRTRPPRCCNWRFQL